MASLIAKRKKNKLYYYVVDSARVQGRPRIVHQTYLGSAEKVAALLKERTAPLPLSASRRELGLPGALWQAAQQSGVFALLQSLWRRPAPVPPRRTICCWRPFTASARPAPKLRWPTGISRPFSLPSGALAERFSSQAFWDCFEQLLPEKQAEEQSEERDPLEEAQARLLGLWKEKQLVGRRLLAYDTTNFHTFIATTNTRNTVAQRGHNKQGRHNLRQVGLSYVLEGTRASPCAITSIPATSPTRRNSRSPGTHPPPARSPHDSARDGHSGFRQGHGGAGQYRFAERGRIRLDFGAALEPGPGGIPSARGRSLAGVQQYSAGRASGGGEVAGARGRISRRLKVLGHLCRRATAQPVGLFSKVLAALKRLAVEMARPGHRLTEAGVQAKISRWLAAPFLSGLVHYQIVEEPGGKRLVFQVDHAALQELLTHRLGRTLLATNRLDWTPEQVVAAYAGQQQIERVFAASREATG